jgi:L-rhamnonate dehydratase
MDMSGRASIARVERGQFTATRPRLAGANARRGVHGREIDVPFVRITTSDGAAGVGRAHLDADAATQLIGMPLRAFYKQSGLITAAFRRIENPLLDLAGVRAGRPVYALAAEAVGAEAPVGPFRVRCYDTSLYFDDLHLDDNDAAADLIAGEARDGFALGHRAFKIKVGRGNRYLPLEKGTARDIAVIRAVRAAVGTECEIMIDANNGYNLNLAKQVLDATADCRLYWLEEAFHEDAELYRDLKEWLRARNLPVCVADGEGDASPQLIDWAREGLIDVLQYDVFGYGFCKWLELGPTLDAMNVGSACHHYGAFCGNYVTGHLASAIRGFEFVEWDAAFVPGLDAFGYEIRDGFVTLPDVPGFGWELDEGAFSAAKARGGYDIRA